MSPLSGLKWTHTGVVSWFSCRSKVEGPEPSGNYFVLLLEGDCSDEALALGGCGALRQPRVFMEKAAAG